MSSNKRSYVVGVLMMANRYLSRFWVSIARLVTSTARPPSEVIETLNRYFDCVIPPIKSHGGEVLEFLGDGILAILNESGERSAREACQSAFEAAREGIEGLSGLSALKDDSSDRPRHLKAGFALHYGEVSYGNIGAGDRLDFTVIGPDVNLTSRIERLLPISVVRLPTLRRFGWRASATRMSTPTGRRRITCSPMPTPYTSFSTGSAMQRATVTSRACAAYCTGQWRSILPAISMYRRRAFRAKATSDLMICPLMR